LQYFHTFYHKSRHLL